MKIKTKLSSGIIFLFAAFIIVGAFSLFFTVKISNQVNLIMKDNHLSLIYMEEMLQSLDSISSIHSERVFKGNQQANLQELQKAIENFEQNRVKETKNITEQGEKEEVELMNQNFLKFKKLLATSVKDSSAEKSGLYFSEITPVLTALKKNLFTISDLNMKAIVAKSNSAKVSASHSYIILSGITTICVFVFFAFIFGFPDYIANPIRELSEAASEISKNNFTARVNFSSGDEFGEIAKAFNTMAGQLEEYSNEMKNLPLHWKERSEAAMNNIHEALIILDENQRISFTNSFAEKLLKLRSAEMLSKSLPQLAAENEIFRYLLDENDTFHLPANKGVYLEFNGRKSLFKKTTDIITAGNNLSEVPVPIGKLIYLNEMRDLNS
jgi:nitrogen fixation/metabolism regulation signal transduction histidine kinase